ncbi:MAG: putative metal-binding motif-containing protein [Deltaproteobacteria bacterium]|nr:putative metal-binding motif-containing protein [Deltaproteobacteria bacterium]
MGASRSQLASLVWLSFAVLGGVGCAEDVLVGPCDGKPSTDDDGDGRYAPGSCMTPNDDCDDGDVAVYPGAVELCDGVDNNCDGLSDEGFPMLGKLCPAGEGLCGRYQCDTAGTGVSCAAVNTQPSPEICDGDDNDCDGQIDEGFTLTQSCAAGVGECHRTGVTVCNAAHNGVECSVIGGAPQPEICDNRDNNCDGQVDEGVTESCLDCHGNVIGARSCSAGVLGGCPAVIEICDGIDNDCDGQIDDGCEISTTELAKLGAIEAEDGGAPGCGLAAYAGNVAGTIMVRTAALPGLADQMVTHPERYGVYILDGTFYGPQSTLFNPPYAGESPTSWCGRATFSSPIRGQTLVERGGSGGTGYAYFAVQKADPQFVCNDREHMPLSCFGNPMADPLWLCGHGEVDGNCSDTSPQRYWDADAAIISCARDVETHRPSPWSIALVLTTGNILGTVDFGDGVSVTFPEYWPNGSDPTPWPAPRTEALTALAVYQQAVILVHTYPQGNTTYTIRANANFTSYLNGTDHETWMRFKTTPTNDPTQCPVLFYPTPP